MRINETRPFKGSVAAAFPHTVPVLTGFLVLGIAYGMLMQSKGYGAPWALLMSGVAYCGSMQFAAISLLTRLIRRTVSTYSFWGGNWIVASPECTPANSICSLMA